MEVSIREIHQSLCYGAGGPGIDEPTMAALQNWYDLAAAEWAAAGQPELPTNEHQEHELGVGPLPPFAQWLLSCSPCGGRWFMTHYVARNRPYSDLSHNFWMNCSLFTEVYNMSWELL